MHIPDGFLGPKTYLALSAAMVPVWAVAAARVKKNLKARQIPMLSLGAAFSFIIMMFNVPIVGGSTGHAVGAALVAIVLGPLAATISVSIALVIQALIFGDGGITAIGANCFNMAFVMPLIGHALYRRVGGNSPGKRRRLVAAGVAGYVSILCGAIVAGVEFGLQPLLEHSAAGLPLYAPYPLAVAVPAMTLQHLFFFAPLEALVTMGVVAVLARQDERLIASQPGSRPLGWLWVGLAVLVLLTPIGVLAPGSAWGEWSIAELRTLLGYVPAGLEKLGGLWRSAIPDYAPAFIKNPLVGYGLSAVIGAGLVVAAGFGIGALLAGRNRSDPAEDEAPTAVEK